MPFIKKSYLCNLNEEQTRKIREKKECVVLITNIGQYKHHLTCWFKNKTQQKKFERLLPRKREEFILGKVYTKNSSIFDLSIKNKKLEYKEKELKLTKEDVKFLKAFCEGGVKKTLKELSHETGLSIDVVYYRKKRLISNGYFTYFVAQPGFGIIHLDFSYIYIKTNKKTFPDISRMPLFAETNKGVLLGFFSKDINDFNSTIDKIYDYYRNDCHSSVLVTNKEHIILNRYPFEFLFSEKTKRN